VEDLRLIETLLQDWMSTDPPDPLLHLDVTTEDLTYHTTVAEVLNLISI